MMVQATRPRRAPRAAPGRRAASRPLAAPSPRSTRRARDRVVERLDRISERPTSRSASATRNPVHVRPRHGAVRDREPRQDPLRRPDVVAGRAERRPLTAAQRLDAEEMLVRSENDPALRAYFALGGPSRDRAGARRRVRVVRASASATGFWGHSTTTPRDGREAARSRAGPPPSRPTRCCRTPCRASCPSSDSGVSVLADRGTPVQLKVGWVRDPDGWVVNSSGRVVVDGSPVLISVMTDRNPTLEAGVDDDRAGRPAGRRPRAGRRATDRDRLAGPGHRIRDRQADPK